MKGIIVVDIPETCGKCIAFKEWSGVCLASDHEYDMMDEGKKPEWCPIKPVPDKVSEIDELIFVPSRYAEGYMDGWNDCIDKILKGKENE